MHNNMQQICFSSFDDCVDSAQLDRSLLSNQLVSFGIFAVHAVDTYAHGGTDANVQAGSASACGVHVSQYLYHL